jgi:hypothetical protein
MDVFAGLFVLFALAVLGCILAVVLVFFWWTVRARKKACLEMKRHVQRNA